MVKSFSFWRDKRVLITGHTGFKGSWLSLWLKSLGAEVTGFALAPDTKPSLFEITRLNDGIRSTIGDVRDRNQLFCCLNDTAPEIVIHMAAQSLVRFSYKDPFETYETNVMGTVNLLDAVRHTPSVRAVLVVTSDKCYENAERELGYREDEAMGGCDPYSSSKGCAELVVSAYRRSFFGSGEKVAIASARAGNVIGGGDWSEDRLIPDMVRSFSAGEIVKIRNPSAIRPWQHVFEALHGYLLLLENMWEAPTRYSEAWNFGPEDKDSRNVGWIVQRFAALWGKAEWKVEADGQNFHEAGILRLDCNKARQVLCWNTTLSLDQAFEWIVEWYQCYYNRGDIAALSQRQLEAFQVIARP
jgi:CDP-glucose 4,6-dehydratase